MINGEKLKNIHHNVHKFTRNLDTFRIWKIITKFSKAEIAALLNNRLAVP